MLITQKVYEKPPTGIYTSVFADYVDLGMKINPFAKGNQPKERPRILFTWILNAQDSEGNYYRIQKEVTKSLHDKAGLREVVLNMTGVNPGTDFELETLIGKCNLVAVKKGVSTTGKPKATIESFMPAKEAFAVPATFTRQKDKTNDQATTQTTAAQTAAPAASPAAQAAPAVAEEDIPF